MTDKLTNFEAYIYHRNDRDVEFDIDNTDNGVFLFGVMDSMQENFKAEYDELMDNCCNALDVGERVEAIHGRTTQKHLLSDEEVISSTIQDFVKDTLKEAIYKKGQQEEEIDGSYQVKQYVEIERMG